MLRSVHTSYTMQCSAVQCSTVQRNLVQHSYSSNPGTTIELMDCVVALQLLALFWHGCRLQVDFPPSLLWWHQQYWTGCGWVWQSSRAVGLRGTPSVASAMMRHADRGVCWQTDRKWKSQCLPCPRTTRHQNLMDHMNLAKQRYESLAPFKKRSSPTHTT